MFRSQAKKATEVTDFSMKSGRGDVVSPRAGTVYSSLATSTPFCALPPRSNCPIFCFKPFFKHLKSRKAIFLSKTNSILRGLSKCLVKIRSLSKSPEVKPIKQLVCDMNCKECYRKYVESPKLQETTKAAVVGCCLSCRHHREKQFSHSKLVPDVGDRLDLIVKAYGSYRNYQEILASPYDIVFVYCNLDVKRAESAASEFPPRKLDVPKRSYPVKSPCYPNGTPCPYWICSFVRTTSHQREIIEL